MADVTWIDAHCHLADPRLADRLPDVLARSRQNNIVAWVQGGIGPEDWEAQKRLVERFGPAIVPTFGLHPWWVATHSAGEISGALDLLDRELSDPECPARGLGELGLDLGPRYAATEKAQTAAFVAQLEIARTRRLPPVLHIVRAHATAAALLKKHGPFPQGGLVHSFSGSREEARAYLDLGLTLSISGAVTRKGFQNLKNAIFYLPLAQIALETDSPDQTPWLPGLAADAPNEPAHLVGIAQSVAALRNEAWESLLTAASAGVRKIFLRNPV